MNTRMKRILSAILVLAMLTAGMPALASEPAVGGEQEQNVPGSGPDTILLADEGGESMDGDPDEGAPADGEPADGEPAADEPADGEPAGGAAAMPTPAPGNPSIADAGDDDVFVPQGTEPPVMKTTSPQSNISTIPDFMGDDDVFVPQGMEPTFMKAASPQNNTRAIPAFTIPPGVSPPTLPPFIYPVLVVWQNVDIPRTYGEEGYDTLPTAGFIFRDMMPGVSQTPIHLDIEITDPDGNVVTEITKVGTYTATIISDDPPGCKIAYYFSNCGPKSVTFEVKNEYQIIWSNLERAFGSQGWRTPPVAKCTIRGVTYEFPVKMYNYYGEEITSATFDNLMYDFKGPNSDYNCTAVAQMDQMADVIPNFSDYQFLDTSTKFKFNPLGFNVLVKEAVRSGSSTATITAVYGDPVVLTGEVSHLQYENVEPHILEMINAAAPTMYYVNPRKSFPYAVGTHTDSWIILGCNVDGINSSNLNAGVEYDHRNGYILQIVHKIVEPDWANIADRTWGEVGWDAMPIATFTDINGVAQPLTLTLKKRGNNGFAPVSSVDGTGEYSVTVSMPDNNYALKNPDGDDAIDNITKTFVVSPAEIEITWTDANDRTFGLTGWDALPTAKYIMAGTEYTPDVKVTKGNTTVTALDPTASVTGEYKAVAQVEDTVNYTFTKGKETTFNIDQLAVQITSEQFVPGADGAVLAKLYGEDEPEYSMYDGNTIAQPMGKNIFGHFEDEEGNLTGAHRYVTPFNVDEMRAAIAAGTPEATAFDVPLLAYAGYQVGTMTFRYDAENNQLIMTPAIDESFRVEGAQPRMTVYTECPTIEELVRATHENASFDPIPLADVSGTLYIYAEFDVHVDQETITGSEGFITFTPDALEAMGGTIGTLYTKFQNQ